MRSRRLCMLTILIPIVLIIVACAFPFMASTPSNVVYVDWEVAVSGDGTSWDQAINDLQAAIDEAALHATAAVPWEVWVKNGTYVPAHAPSIDDYGSILDNHFALRSHVYIYGGFSGTEHEISQRNLASSDKTILSGVLPESAGNVYHVVYLPDNAGVTDAELRDVTIRGGGATGTQPKGGALYLGIGSGSYITSTRCSLLFDNVTFSDSSSDGMGGAVYINDVDGVLFENCLFTRNSAVTGGNAVTLEDCSPEASGNAWIRFTGCGFLDNTNKTGTTLEQNSGGGGAIQLHESKALYDFCTFMQNSTAGNGGAIAIHSGDGSNDTDVLITNSLLANNSAGSNGGALFLEYGGM